MFLLRGAAVWIVIIFAETVHGILRTMFLDPLIGGFRARQIGVFVGCVIIGTIAYLSIRWIGAFGVGKLLLVGVTWVILTLGFEFTIIAPLAGLSRERVFEDYDIARGGLMPIGLLFMAAAPYLAARFRGNRAHSS